MTVWSWARSPRRPAAAGGDSGLPGDGAGTRDDPPGERIEEVVEQLARDGLDHVLATAVDGTLIRLAIASDLHV